MLPATQRITRSKEFTRVVRTGARAGRGSVVVHAVRDPDAVAAGDPPRAGFVVSKAVGHAVARNRVSRRLRHVVRDLLPGVPAGALIVVRALPPAAQARTADLADDVAGALRSAVRRAA